MDVELLPSSIPPTDAQFLVSFLVNETVAIDAGAVGFLADLQRQRRVRHVFVTHEHLDHIASLPILLENVFEPGPECVEILARQSVLDFLHDDIFNGRVWPDFFELSSGEDRFVEATPLRLGEPVRRSGLTVTPLPVAHCGESCGLLVDDGRVAVAFPSDTGPTSELWDHLARCDRLAAVFLETSFPNSLQQLATDTGHHCPATFAREVRKLPGAVRWIVVHRKARYREEIARELTALGIANLEFVEPGNRYVF